MKAKTVQNGLNLTVKIVYDSYDRDLNLEEIKKIVTSSLRHLIHETSGNDKFCLVDNLKLKFESTAKGCKECLKASNCLECVERGHLQCLKLARIRGCRWDQSSCIMAIEKEYEDIFEWLVANGCPCPG